MCWIHIQGHVVVIVVQQEDPRTHCSSVGQQWWPGGQWQTTSLRPASWSPFLIVWSETFTSAACWRSFCSSGCTQTTAAAVDCFSKRLIYRLFNRVFGYNYSAGCGEEMAAHQYCEVRPALWCNVFELLKTRRCDGVNMSSNWLSSLTTLRSASLTSINAGPALLFGPHGVCVCVRVLPH